MLHGCRWVLHGALGWLHGRRAVGWRPCEMLCNCLVGVEYRGIEAKQGVLSWCLVMQCCTFVSWWMGGSCSKGILLMPLSGAADAAVLQHPIDDCFGHPLC